MNNNYAHSVVPLQPEDPIYSNKFTFTRPEPNPFGAYVEIIYQAYVGFEKGRPTELFYQLYPSWPELQAAGFVGSVRTRNIELSIEDMIFTEWQKQMEPYFDPQFVNMSIVWENDGDLSRYAEEAE